MFTKKQDDSSNWAKEKEQERKNDEPVVQSWRVTCYSPLHSQHKTHLTAETRMLMLKSTLNRKSFLCVLQSSSAGCTEEERWWWRVSE